MKNVNPQTAKWHATPLSGGTKSGIHDAGIETFKASGLTALVREAIQNSLDACDESDKPVEIEFECFELPVTNFPNRSDFVEILNRCAQSSVKQREADQFFNTAISLLSNGASSLRVLRVSDYNTKGLCGARSYKENTDTDTPWECLVKASGTSAQKGGSSGGSFGIGKRAAFACSSLRTVFYSSFAIDGVMSSIGFAKLISYIDDTFSDYTTGEVFYSDDRKKKSAIFSLLRLGPGEARQRHGTDIYIMAFDDGGSGESWGALIRDAVLQNFLISVWRGQLKVTVQTDKIEQETLGQLVEKLSQSSKDHKSLGDYYRMLTSNSTNIHRFQNSEEEFRGSEEDDYAFDAGECELVLMDGEDLSSKVLFSRKPGMKLFEKGFHGPKSYLGILLIAGDKMNEAFRTMEVPEHNAWKPARCSNGKNRKRAEKQWSDLKRFIERKIKEAFGCSETQNIDAFGANDFLPDEGDLGSKEGTDEPVPTQSIRDITVRESPTRVQSGLLKKKANVKPKKGGEAIRKNLPTKPPLPGPPKPRGAQPAEDGSDGFEFAPLETQPRLMCASRSRGEYRVTFVMPSSATKSRLHFAITGESGSSSDIQISSARKIEGPLLCSVSVEGGRIVVASPQQGEKLIIAVQFNKLQFSFDYYCTMEIKHYESVR